MASTVWGDETHYFYDLTPDKILDAVELSGMQCTGRCFPYNSMENRVYEIEIENDGVIRSPSDRFVVAKFYRPGRWSAQQIADEHQFLNDLQADEIPVIAPRPFADGSTLIKMVETQIYFALFPKCGGRAPDEFTDDQLSRMGRLLARMHVVGSASVAQHRLRIDPHTYGLENLAYLVEQRILPAEIEKPYARAVENICNVTTPWFKNSDYHRIHGDCHFGNILWGSDGPFLVDFDDMVMGPSVQDIWLMTPGRDDETYRQRQILLNAYKEMRDFDDTSLRLIEPLRALRFVHFSSWIAKRWSDPAFKNAFSHFDSPRYWSEQLADIKEQEQIICQSNDTR